MYRCMKSLAVVVLVHSMGCSTPTASVSPAAPGKITAEKGEVVLRLTLEHHLVKEAKNAASPELNWTHIHLLEGDPNQPATKTFVGKVRGACHRYGRLEDLRNEGSTKANTLVYFLQCWNAGQGMDVSVWQKAEQVQVKTRVTDETISLDDRLALKTKRSIDIAKGTRVKVGDRKAPTVVR